MNLPLEVVVGSNYVKYDKLSQLIYEAYAGSNATELNIFIDLYSILKPMFSSDMDIHYQMSSDLELSASIINMCAHYRSFFYNMGVNTKFFLIFGLNSPMDNQILSPGYNEKFIHSYSTKGELRKLVEMNLSILKLLCDHLPNIFFFNIGDKEVSGYIEYLLSFYKFNDKGINPNGENIIITKDILPLQLVSSGCTILRPKKSKGVDNSFIINSNNFWVIFMGEMRNVISHSAVIKNNVEIGYFSNILAMTRIPERSMASIKSIPIAYDILSKGSSLGYLNSSDGYSQSTVNKVLEILGINVNYTTLEMRWKAISSKFAAQYIIPNTPGLCDAKIVNIHDPDGVREIVSKYYAKSPIDLDRL